ncbi:MAG TPA: hypothetical protein DCL41_07445 [Bdellovibrionales bacterium]|nr:hypothetical protein [Bdellovibrionales bacterium]
MTERIFGEQGKNDESDAFRHFAWSALLVKEIGLEKARLFLLAHEQDPKQPLHEKEMDTENNKKGLLFAAERLKNKKSLNLDKIEKEALKRLKAKKLKVLKSSRKKIPEGYYSK